MKKKLVMIGAGSAMFTQGIIVDLLQKNPGGHQWTIGLCDTNAEVLADVKSFVQKMVQEKGETVEIEASTDRREVIPGADYIVSTIGVGGRQAWEQDVVIPRKYGVYQPVGDTLMPGGISRALRMVPAMVDIVQDVKKIAPQARFFNYSNPMAVICSALSQSVDFPVTGLCIGTVESAMEIADYMGYDRKSVTTFAAGLNHCTFIYDIRVDGVSVIEDIYEKARHDYGSVAVLNPSGKIDAPDTVAQLENPFCWSFFLKYKAYPAPGDRHVSEFFTEYFNGGRYYGKKLGMDAFSFEKTIYWGNKIHDEIVTKARSEAPLGKDFFSQFHGEHEQLIDIIDAIERDSRKLYYANLPNEGAVPNISRNAILEMPAVATANGLYPVIQKAFPNELAAFTNRFSAHVQLVVEAALKGNRTLVEEAIMSGGYMNDISSVRNMVEELLTAHKMDLPQF